MIGALAQRSVTNTAERAQVELAKFFALVGEGIGDLTMISPYVDEIWHSLMADANEYAAYCSELVGHTVVHSSASGCGMVAWVREYETRFGPLDRVWFMNKDGALDDERWTSYALSGAHGMQASWDCKPLDVPQPENPDAPHEREAPVEPDAKPDPDAEKTPDDDQDTE